jgi:hypothetical protein
VVVGERTAVCRWAIPFSPQDPIEQDLDGMGAEPTGEALAVVGEDLIGDPEAVEPGHEHRAHGFGGRPRDETSGDAEPAVVVETRHDLALGRVLEHHATHHVHLP